MKQPNIQIKHSSLSQEKRILEYLQEGKRLTPTQALRRFGCFRLSARIFRLKSEGHEIKSRPYRISPTKIVAQYYLEQ